VQKHLVDIFYLSKINANVPAILAQGVMVFWLSYYISEGIHLAFFLSAISRLCFFLDSNENSPERLSRLNISSLALSV